MAWETGQQRIAELINDPARFVDDEQ